jgi:outer membrane protein assembly factor BamB
VCLASAAVIVAAAVAGGLSLATASDRASSRSHASVARGVVPSLAPPGPIPGYLLIADRGNNRMLLVDSRGRILWRYPRPGRRPAMPVRFADDTFFAPGTPDRIISNQEDQHTIQIVSFPGGRLLWRYGRVNIRGSRPGYLNTPDDAYLLPNGDVSVADAYNCRVLFISPAHRIVRQYGSASSCRHDPPRRLGAINGATPLPDGGVLVSEINGSWVDDISAGGHLRWSVQAPVSYPSDPQLLAPNRILLADYARPGHAIIMTRTGRVLWRYGPSSGPGMLDHPSLATRIAPGLIAINDDYRDRVVIVSLSLRRIVWQYGHTDVAGSGPGYLRTPDGLDLLSTARAERLPQVRALLVRHPARTRHVLARSAAPPPTVTLTAAHYRLPAPVQREVAVASGGGVVIVGGLNAAKVSTNGVFRLDPVSGRLSQLGVVPNAFHDAAGALLRGSVFVFGGGAGESTATVQRFDLRTRRGAVVARLPRALSDLAAATIGPAAYLVGGFDGRIPRAEIYRTTDGRHFTVAGRLPVGLRYPAVAAVSGDLIVAGGITASGASSAVYDFSPVTGRTKLIARLPEPVGHASPLVLGNRLYLVGGADANGRTVGRVTALDLGGRKVLPVAAVARVSDAGAVVVAGRGLVIGGETDGRTVAVVRVLSAPSAHR